MSQFCGDTEFQKVLAGREDVSLELVMLEIAADADPGLDRVESLMHIDHLAVSCEAALSTKRNCPKVKIETIGRVLFEIEGFHGDRETYYDPANSYLNQVLERRAGIPISLGIVFMAVAARLGLRMYGLNLPSRFMIGCEAHPEPLIVDPFHLGEILTRGAAVRRIESLIGQTGVLGDREFAPAPARAIMARVLRNLKAAYAMTDRWCEALPVQRRLCELLPHAADEMRDLGLICLRTGLPSEALRLLERYQAGECSESNGLVEASIRVARKLLAEMN